MAFIAFKAFHTSFLSIWISLMNPLLLSLIIGVVLGTANYIRIRKKGYKSLSQLFLSILVFFGLALTILKYFLKN